MELFGVSVIEIVEEDPTILAHELPAFVVPTIDMYEGNVGPIEGARNSVDPPLSFDILSGLCFLLFSYGFECLRVFVCLL